MPTITQKLVELSTAVDRHPGSARGHGPRRRSGEVRPGKPRDRGPQPAGVRCHGAPRRQLTADQFESDRWAKDDVAALVGRIKVTPNAEYPKRYPQGRPADIRIALANGVSLTDFQDVPAGDASRPMDDLAIDRKFMANAEERIGRSHARAVLESVKRLETLKRVEELTHLLAAS